MVVNYHRVRCQLAYPLPVSSIVIPSISVGNAQNYSWSYWMIWQLEERVNALRWAAEWFKDRDFVRCLSRDLEALAVWPKLYQHAQPDLTSGDTGRILWTAYTKWRWLSRELRERIRAARAPCGTGAATVGEELVGRTQIEIGFLGSPAPAVLISSSTTYR
jgi:hypothetical protein